MYVKYNNSTLSINAKQATIEDLNCEGNKDLKSVPVDMRGRTDMIMWCLRLQCHYQKKLTQKTAAYDAVVKHVRQCEELQALAEEDILQFEENELRSLRNLIRESEPYVRRKSTAVKAWKRLRNAFYLLFKLHCGRNDDNILSRQRPK